MPPKTSPATVFVFTHRWLITSIALLAVGLIGISAVAWLAPQSPLAVAGLQQASSLPARAVQQAILGPEQSLASAASGVFLFLSIVCLVIWLYGLARHHSLLPELNSVSIKELASKKLIVVLGVATGFGVLLYWSLVITLLATPFSAPAVGDFALYSLLLTLLAVVSVISLFFLAQGRLLASWLPFILCSKCQEHIALVNYWQCVGGCKVGKMRHVLSPCPTCGTKSQGLACTNQYCGEAFGFDDFYNEFTVVNRTKKYVTQYNPLFWGVLLGLGLSLLLLYVCFQIELTILCFLFGLLVLGSGITMIVVKPKRLIRNQHYVEGEQQWTRRATA